MNIMDTSLMVRRVKINPSVLIAHAKYLELSTAKYPITRVDVKAFTIPSDVLGKTIDNVYLGQLPKRIVVGLVNNKAFNGSFLHNPFNFQHFNMNLLALYIDGHQVPSKALQPYYTELYAHSYHTLFSGCGIHYTNGGNGISREMYPNGYCLYTFDLTPDLSSDLSLEPYQKWKPAHRNCRNVEWIKWQGSGVIKAGFAGDQIPKCCFPNYIGRPKHVRVMAGALEGDIFVGPKAEEYRGLLSIRYPMEHGVVTDWNDMERIWSYIYSNDQLQTFSEEHPVLLTEAPLNPRRNREKAAEIFFESFNVPALYVSMQAVLSLYATGRTTGVVLDSGDGVTHAVPIYEGFAMPHSIMRVDIAGRDVSKYLRLLLRKEGVNFRTTAEFEIVRTIKEKACYLSSNPQKEETAETEKYQYILPDGNTLDIGPARFRAPEVLFRPDLIGEEYEGLHEVLLYAIQKSDMDLRKVLFQNIVLSGGSTLFKGFGDKLLSEVRRLAPKDIKIRISAPQERLYSTWIGGSILASLDTFKRMWVSKREFDEEGRRAIHRKTF